MYRHLDYDFIEIPHIPDHGVTRNGLVISFRYNRIKAPTVDWNGYKRVNIYGKKHYVHRLVFETFGRFIPNHLVINHKDGDKLNNTFENLEMVTQAENCKHAVKLGLYPKGKKRPNFKQKSFKNT